MFFWLALTYPALSFNLFVLSIFAHTFVTRALDNNFTRFKYVSCVTQCRSVDEDYARQAQAVAREMAAVAERSAEKAEQVNVRAALDNEISNNRARADADALIQKVKNELAYNETAFKELAHVRVVSELHKMFLNNSEHVLKYFWIKSLTGAEKWMIPHNASIRFDHM